MSFEIKGKVKVIMDVQTFDSGFSKREFVVTTDDQYPQDLKFELFKEKADMISAFNVNDPVLVRFDIRGREWNENYYVNLNAWKIEPLGASQPADASGAMPPPNAAPMPQSEPLELSDDDEDDLPF